MKDIAYRFIFSARKAYWFLFRPKTYGVKVLIEHNGKFLMIRNSYGKYGWTFPGGGVKPEEKPKAAALRETREEVGIELKGAEYIGDYFSTREYKRDTVHCFHAAVNEPNFKVDGDEVVEAAYFAPNEMPSHRSSAVAQVLGLYRQFRESLIE